jgi:hypothetical protein
MGYWYWRQLKNAWAIDENTTNRFDLPEQGAVSGLAVRMSTTNEADLSNYDDPFPMQRLSKLRIVGNGNYPIVDLMGKMVHAMNFWDRGEMTHDTLSFVDTETQNVYLYIPFGRYMGDMDYGLKLEEFAAGVQWEETNNISTTYYADGYTTMSIHALMRKNPEANLFSKGYLRKRQIIKKDANSETKYAVKLPTMNKLRQVHLFSEPTYSSGVLSTTCFTLTQYLFLSIKSREEYLLDNVLSSDWARFIHDYAERRATSSIRFRNAAAGDYYDTMIDERLQGSIQLLQAAAIIPATLTATDQTRFMRFYEYDDAGSASASHWWRATSEGILLHGDIPLLTLKPDAPEEQWLDAGANKDVYVEVTEGSGSGNWYIVLDELEKAYPS